MAHAMHAHESSGSHAHTLHTAKGEMHGIVAPAIDITGGKARGGHTGKHAHHSKHGHHPVGAKHMARRGR